MIFNNQSVVALNLALSRACLRLANFDPEEAHEISLELYAGALEEADFILDEIVDDIRNSHSMSNSNIIPFPKIRSR